MRGLVSRLYVRDKLVDERIIDGVGDADDDPHASHVLFHQLLGIDAHTEVIDPDGQALRPGEALHLRFNVRDGGLLVGVGPATHDTGG